jgi:hypothetical protein
MYYLPPPYNSYRSCGNITKTVSHVDNKLSVQSSGRRFSNHIVCQCFCSDRNII